MPNIKKSERVERSLQPKEDRARTSVIVQRATSLRLNSFKANHAVSVKNYVDTNKVINYLIDIAEFMRDFPELMEKFNEQQVSKQKS